MEEVRKTGPAGERDKQEEEEEIRALTKENREWKRKGSQGREERLGKEKEDQNKRKI